MKAVVVYQSLWGSTGAIAEAIAEGLGKGAQALSTTDATPEAIAGADLIVAGAPIHAFSMPTEGSVQSAQAKPAAGVAPDVSHVLMRTWLRRLSGVEGAAAAAFDTRVAGPLGHGGAPKIARGLKKAGCRLIAEPRGFRVAMRPADITIHGMLLEGEVERAREWGAELRAALDAK